MNPLRGTEPARYRFTNRVNCCPDFSRPVALEERGQDIILSAIPVEQEVEAMVNLRIFQYPVAPKGSTPARYTLNN